MMVPPTTYVLQHKHGKIKREAQALLEAEDSVMGRVIRLCGVSQARVRTPAFVNYDFVNYEISSTMRTHRAFTGNLP